MPEQAAPPRYSDDARRCSDIITLHATCGNAGQFVAIRLSDGGSDNQLYPTRAEAISHQLRPEYCTYVQVQPGGMIPAEAEALLGYWRNLRDANVRDDDPYQQMPLMPLLARDRAAQIAVLRKGR